MPDPKVVIYFEDRNRKHIPMPDGKQNPIETKESIYNNLKKGIISRESVYAEFTGADGNEYQFAEFLLFPHTPNIKIISYNNMTAMQGGGKKRRSTRRRKVRRNKTRRGQCRF